MSCSKPTALGAALLLASAAVACSGGSGSTIEPPPPDVSGGWSGDWTQQGPSPSPATGEISMQLAQPGDGTVSGTATFTEIACLSTAMFQGATVDLVLIGTATEAPDVEVRFQIDIRHAEQGAFGTLTGTFTLVAGSGCPPPFQATFLATGIPPVN